jgi:hypothetical protein
MDRKLPKDQEIQRLIRLGEAARSCLEHEAVLLHQRLDVPARIRGSLKEHPAGWLLGSLASGLAASLLLRLKPRRPAEKKPRGLALSLLGLTLTAIRPMAKVWLTDQVKNYLTGQSRTSATSSTQLSSKSL